RTGDAPLLARRLYHEFQRWDAVSSLVAEGLALEIIAATALRPPSEPERPRWLGEVRDLLHQHYHEPLSLRDAATAVGVHPSHLARVFRREHGCTIGDYVRRLRVEAACRKIASEEAPLAEIALSCGFADQSHLTRTFRRETGLTPGEYAARTIRSNKANRVQERLDALE
ncbi:MAG: AraC family transcriptional regulator, partial [Chloroflexota bacterium]